ncbi:MAG: hypothetical protein Kow0089_13560 [Desulfobulbaceae bacterium]
MTDRQSRKWWITVLLLMGLAVTGGCGYKTRPVPPEQIVPRPITDLRYELNERGVTLSWTYPVETVRGERLQEIDRFLVYRAVVPVDDYCENCPLPFGEPVEIEGGVVSRDTPRTGEYATTLLRPGHLYFFKIRSRSGWWAESADSNLVSFLWDIPPAAPASLEADGGDGAVSLRWSPVTTRVDGSPVAGPVAYRVFRAETAAFAQLPGLVRETAFVDRNVAGGNKYRYRVQAVAVSKGGEVGGGISPVAEALVADRTPPPVPEGVQGIRTAQGVKIIWERVEAPDLGGYRVYRRAGGEATPVLAGEVGVEDTLFDDTGMPEADEWYYTVTSVDRAQPPNESAPSAEVEVRN